MYVLIYFQTSSRGWGSYILSIFRSQPVSLPTRVFDRITGQQHIFKCTIKYINCRIRSEICNPVNSNGSFFRKSLYEIILHNLQSCKHPTEFKTNYDYNQFSPFQDLTPPVLDFKLVCPDIAKFVATTPKPSTSSTPTVTHPSNFYGHWFPGRKTTTAPSSPSGRSTFTPITDTAVEERPAETIPSRTTSSRGPSRIQASSLRTRF